MIFKIIDRCCNEYKTIEVKDSDIVMLGKTDKMVEIAPAKKGHSIIIHKDMTIEYVPTNN